MANSIIDYLQAHIAPFSEAPFNEVDSLVLSTLCYFHLEHGSIQTSSEGCLVPLAQAICGIPYSKLIGDCWLKNFDGSGFLAALLQSPRFMSLTCAYYVDEFSDVLEKQFSAVTFFLPDDTAYVAFRGTDNTLAGWKEDFNLTFMKSTLSQLAARVYLEKIANLNVAMIFVGGHSKGGNLAEYATITCDETTYKKVARVYNHDGPSFTNDVAHRMSTIDYRNRLHKTVPESSIFGLLMERRADYRIVKASGVLLEQHAPFNWLVEQDHFVEADCLSSNAAIIGRTLTDWACSYPPEQREYFIDNAYHIVRAAGINSMAELTNDTLFHIRTIIEQASKTDPSTRQEMADMLGDAFGFLRDSALDKAREKFPARPKLPDFIEENFIEETKDV